MTRRAAGTQMPPDDLCQQLARRLREETQAELLFDAASRGRYATDASIYQIMPVGVLVPRTPDDVATALAVAAELKVPVLPRGGGTSQCGQTTGAALVVDCSKHLRRVLDVDVGDVPDAPGVVAPVAQPTLQDVVGQVGGRRPSLAGRR